MAAVQAVLQSLNQPRDVSILRFRDSIAAGNETAAARPRTSDVSADNFDAQNDAADSSPASLAADLAHYKELFSKLRFSYIEHLTKESFLRALVEEPPLLVESQENSELEAQLVEAKAGLNARKEEVATLVEEIERKGRDLSRRYEIIETQKTLLNSLPEEIEGLQTAIESLRSSQPVPSSNPNLRLPLPATLSLLCEKQSELAALNAEIAKLQSALSRKSREEDKLQAELRPLEAQKVAAVNAAKDLMRRRETGENGDGLEERGRWYKAAEASLKGMLEIES